MHLCFSPNCILKEQAEDQQQFTRNFLPTTFVEKKKNYNLPSGKFRLAAAIDMRGGFKRTRSCGRRSFPSTAGRLWGLS